MALIKLSITIKQTKNTWKPLGPSELQMKPETRNQKVHIFPEQLGFPGFRRVPISGFPGFARNRGFLEGFPHVGGGLG